MRIKEVELERYPITTTYRLGNIFYKDGKEFIIIGMSINKYGDTLTLELEENHEFGYNNQIEVKITEFTSEQHHYERWYKELH
jgi:hypothetical protein